MPRDFFLLRLIRLMEPIIDLLNILLIAGHSTQTFSAVLLDVATILGTKNPIATVQLSYCHATDALPRGCCI